MCVPGRRYERWGWDELVKESCPPNSTPNTSSVARGRCVDPDGDGWGWDGIGSCRVVVTGEVLVNGALDCVDTDGDGWGWDGTSSCRASTGSVAGSFSEGDSATESVDGNGLSTDTSITDVCTASFCTFSLPSVNLRQDGFSIGTSVGECTLVEVIYSVYDAATGLVLWENATLVNGSRSLFDENYGTLPMNTSYTIFMKSFDSCGCKSNELQQSYNAN